MNRIAVVMLLISAELDLYEAVQSAEVPAAESVAKSDIERLGGDINVLTGRLRVSCFLFPMEVRRGQVAFVR